jgi:hypothetical protein
MRYIWQESVNRNYASHEAFLSYLMGARMRIVHIRSILPALLLSLALPLAAHAQVGIGLSVTIAPPEIPVYEQPPIPDDGYIWTPGFWQWGPDGYYWVPGTWVEPPSVGLLWTPGYWGWGEGVYLFHAGYWGPHVGFYGGVNYGYGYGGAGFEGGYWRGGHMYYNRAVMNVGDVHVTNVYNRTVIVNNNTRVSFNGGAGGVRAEPTRSEMAAAHDRHVEPTTMQTQHVRAASSNRELLATVNHGAPAVAATPRPGVFSGKGVVSANHAPEGARADRPAAAMHSQTYAPAESHAAPVAHAPATHAAPERADRPPTAMHSETYAPAANHQGAPVTHAPTVNHAAPAANQAAARPESRAMSARPPAAAPPHPQVQQHAAPPHPQVQQHAAPPHPAAVAPPHPQVQQHAAPAPKAEPPGHDDRHN